jgi:subtilase family protein/fervidolysin-like protein
MGMPRRTSLARALPLMVAALLSSLPGVAGATEGRRAPAAQGGQAAPGPADPETVTGRTRTGAARERRDAFVPGRVLIGFEAGAGERGQRAATAAVDGRVVARHGRTRVVALDPGADVQAAARRLARRTGVAFAEPDWIRRVDACDPEACWHLQPAPGADVVAAHGGGAHGGGATGAERTVAVVDTGVAAITDLAGRVASRLRCTDAGCAATSTTPASSHGTEVASVIAANDNDIGTTGVAPDATVVSYRVDSTGGGIPVSFLNQALDHIAESDADVVNLSLGGAEWSAGEQAAIDAVLDAGKVVVAASGNNGDHLPLYPAAYPGVISVGATDADGQIAPFSSYGKVDVVAPGACVAVALRSGAPDQDQRQDCPDDPGNGVHYDSGTSFAAPVVAGLLALADSGSPLVARLALESSARASSPGGATDAKQWAHGLVDADAFVAAHDPDAPATLVLETTGADEADGHRFGSGDGQLPHPDTTYAAYAFQAAQGLAANPGTAGFAGAATGTAAFAAVPGESGVFRAALATDPLEPGLREEVASTIIEGEARTGSVPVLVLEPDDQAPGVDLVGETDQTAWQQVGSVEGGDLDDVYAVTLGRGDRLDVTLTSLSDDPVAALLFDDGTTDVFGQSDKVLACGGGLAAGCPTEGVQFQAEVRGTYLIDVIATGPTGDYGLTWTVRNQAGLPIQVAVPACSPDGDGVQDQCTWTAGEVSTGAWTTTSYVTSGTEVVMRHDGTGAHAWDGRNQDGQAQPDGTYKLRVLYTEPGGRTLLRAFVLTLDRDPPGITLAAAAPNPFEPRPVDGDRDTTTFAMTSTDAGRLRAVVYRYASTTVVRVLVSGPQPAGRQRVTWNGRTAAGARLQGRFSYVLQAIDAAGNRSSSRRHYVTIL